LRVAIEREIRDRIAAEAAERRINQAARPWWAFWK